MGLFANPLGHAGYPPGVTGTPTTQPASIRAATAAEAAAGTLDNCYISPATAQSATALDFASPPVLGFGSTTPRPVHGTAIDATTTITATLGDITATNGNFVSSTAGKGLSFNANTATGAAASPIVINSRAGQAIFTSVSIAAAADLTLTITNSAITASTTQVIYSISGATTGSALSIKSVTNSTGSSVIVVTNGTGATTSTANITVNFIVVN
jgi:hypothetical protein